MAYLTDSLCLKWGHGYVITKQFLVGCYYSSMLWFIDGSAQSWLKSGHGWVIIIQFYIGVITYPCIKCNFGLHDLGSYNRPNGCGKAIRSLCQGLFCECAKPMRGDVTLYHQLSLVRRIHRMIPALSLTHWLSLMRKPPPPKKNRPMEWHIRDKTSEWIHHTPPYKDFRPALQENLIEEFHNC